MAPPLAADAPPAAPASADSRATISGRRISRSVDIGGRRPRGANPSARLAIGNSPGQMANGAARSQWRLPLTGRPNHLDGGRRRDNLFLGSDLEALPLPY